MNIGSTTLIGQVATQGVEAGDAAQILALRKALQLQQQQAPIIPTIRKGFVRIYPEIQQFVRVR